MLGKSFGNYQITAHLGKGGMGDVYNQGIDNRLIEPDGRAESASNVIECSERLGGMLRFYHRSAA
jgi:hypothetical protein